MILPNFLSPTKNKGFTLIELLVVIAIISIIMSLGFAGFQRAQINARDAKRTQALDQVKIALELYFDTNLEYPEDNSGQIRCGGADKAWGTIFDCNGQTYMKTLPEDPSGTTDYCYVTTASLDNYTLYAQMENDTNSNIIPEIDPFDCPGSNSYDYSVENIK